eukprot:m.356017 g.356017  ORF g.356017 m.356017 type:complete len:68 (+) comp17419_c0_seq1:480-683(+)
MYGCPRNATSFFATHTFVTNCTIRSTKTRAASSLTHNSTTSTPPPHPALAPRMHHTPLTSSLVYTPL